MAQVISERQFRLELDVNGGPASINGVNGTDNGVNRVLFLPILVLSKTPRTETGISAVFMRNSLLMLVLWYKYFL